MGFNIEAEAMLGTFAVPAQVVDRYIKIATANQLRVLLSVFRNPFLPINESAIGEQLSLPEQEVLDALMFWAEAGLLKNDGAKAAKAQPEETKKAVRAATVRPTREEVARRGLEDSNIAFMLQTTEQKLGRALRQTESSSLVWLHDDEGISIAVLLMVVDYAISENRANIGFIEKTALSWLDSGVTTVPEAEQKIKEIYAAKNDWRIVSKAFGLGGRKAGKKETEFAVLWVGERGYGEELLSEAYSRCVDNTGKYSLQYITKILEKWYKDGVRDIKDVPSDEQPQSGGMGTYDKSAFSRLLGAIDDEEKGE